MPRDFEDAQDGGEHEDVSAIHVIVVTPPVSTTAARMGNTHEKGIGIVRLCCTHGSILTLRLLNIVFDLLCAHAVGGGASVSGLNAVET